MDCSPPGFAAHGADSPDNNIGVGPHALLQGIFQSQGSNPCHPSLVCLLHCRAGSLLPAPPVEGFVLVSKLIDKLHLKNHWNYVKSSSEPFSTLLFRKVTVAKLFLKTLLLLWFLTLALAILWLDGKLVFSPLWITRGCLFSDRDSSLNGNLELFMSLFFCSQSVDVLFTHILD